MWLASLEGGTEILAQATTLEDLFLALNELDLHDDAAIAVMWTGEEPPQEVLDIETGG